MDDFKVVHFVIFGSYSLHLAIYGTSFALPRTFDPVRSEVSKLASTWPFFSLESPDKSFGSLEHTS